MPSIKYYNDAAPLWDLLAHLENEGCNHAWFDRQARGPGANGTSPDEDMDFHWPPWTFAGDFPFRGPPHGPPHGPPPHGPSPGDYHHGPHGHPHHHPHHHHRAPPPLPGKGPPCRPSDSVPLSPFEEFFYRTEPILNEEGESSKAAEHDAPEGRPQRRPGHYQDGSRGGRRRGHCGAGKFGRGPWGGRGGFPCGSFSGLAGQFWPSAADEEEDGNFKPEVDVFNTESAYVVHVSMAGGKKEDISVSWDAEKSELVVSGVLHRPGGEELLQTLALDERKVGVFERKIRLGSLVNPAQVDADGIGAKLEDGILRITVPKLDKDYVEVKMVDVE